MKKIGKRMNHAFQAAAILPTTVLGMGLTVPVHMAHAAAAVDPTEIIVTARRENEELQKVPISMTVFTQETLSDRNVTSGADLVAYTPSLNTNQRFGSDQASFAIRGFSQDLRTTASVAVYFADVVAPRSGGSVTAGDGAGPGAFFDLQNVQVLKGPQGTLFGRNTTGGAIQLVPHKPTDNLEGYVELSAGNFNMRRTQAVVNVPLTDSVRARFGYDAMKRDGYVTNVTQIGPEDFHNVDYYAGRASLEIDISDSVQNYSVLQFANSENNGSIQRIIGCNFYVGLGPLCQRSFNLHENDGNFYSVVNADEPDPVSKLKQTQFVNTTTWNVTDDFDVVNILGYADLLQTMRGSVFGTQFFNTLPIGQDTRLVFFPSGQVPGMPTNSQETFVEELRFLGKAFDQKLSWQAGLYYEDSRPDGWAGSQSPGMLACNEPLGANPANWSCYDAIGRSTQNEPPHKRFAGSVERSIGKMYYNNQAVYAQGTYDIAEQWKFTLGLRYTVDKTQGSSKRVTYLFSRDDLATFGPPITVKCSLSTASLNECRHNESMSSEAVTGTIGLDYFPIDDVMLYAKYSRGYRQGSLVLPAPDGLGSYDPEAVDAYEVGAKTSFQSPIKGTFNISVFYNDLKNQQLQVGHTPQLGGSATTSVQNADTSMIQGVELETTLTLIEDLTFNLAYTYLETRLEKGTFRTVTDWNMIPSAIEGEHLTFSPRHAVSTGLNYRFPFPEEVGDVSFGFNYTFISSQNSTNTAYKLFNGEDSDPSNDVEVKGSPYGELPVRQLLNLNLGWKAIYGSPFDFSFFATNALDEEYNAYVSGQYNSAGGEFGVAGEPRMYGAKIKYTFGQ